MAPQQQVSAVKSLQDLAVAKTIEDLLKCESPTEVFLDLEEHPQRLILNQLLDDHSFYLERSGILSEIKDRTPSVDWQLRTSDNYDIEKPVENSESEPSDTSDPAAGDLGANVETSSMTKEGKKTKKNDDISETNGHVLKELFRKQWDYTTTRIESFRRLDIYHFDADSLNSHDAPDSDFRVCIPLRHSYQGASPGERECSNCNVPRCFEENFCPYDDWCDGRYKINEQHYKINEKISSQLLYYRVTVIFGMPPKVPFDERKMCWRVMLQHEDGSSGLSLSDWKGGANVNFAGTREARDSALALLNFLCSENIPHPFGSPAGTEHKWSHL